MILHKLINPLILFSSSILLVLSLEVNFYSYYFILSLIGAGFLFFSVKLIKVDQGINLLGLLLTFFVLSCLLFSIVHNNLLYLSRAIAIILTFYLCYLLIKQNKKIINYFLVITFFCALISILLQIMNGEFLAWKFIFGRNASLFFDPNYASAIFSISALLSLIIVKQVWLRVILFLTFLLGMSLTYSKGGLLSFTIGLMGYFYCRYSYKSLFYILFLGVLLSISFLFIDVDFSMFRFSQGLNSRDLFFTMTYDHVFNKLNLFGGVDVGELISSIGLGNKSTHNYYLDLLLSNGVIPFVFLIPFLISVIFIGVTKRDEYFPIFISLFVMSNSISVSIGGIGILSIIYTYSIVSILINRKNN